MTIFKNDGYTNSIIIELMLLEKKSITIRSYIHFDYLDYETLQLRIRKVIYTCLSDNGKTEYTIGKVNSVGFVSMRYIGTVNIKRYFQMHRVSNLNYY